MTLNYTLPFGWSITKLTELISSAGEFCDGDWIESKDQDENGSVRLIQLADIGDGVFKSKSNRFLTKEKAVQLKCTYLEHGDVLLARMPDPLGRSCIFPLKEESKYVTVVDVCIIRPGTEWINTKCLTYFINSLPFRNSIAELEQGTTRKRISRKNLSEIPFPLPPLAEQHRIVAKIEELFSDLDAGIASLKKAKEQLKTYQQSVLKWAFDGKLSMNWRKLNSPTPIKTLLLKIFKEREITTKSSPPEINPPTFFQNLPREWIPVRIGDVAHVGTGGTPLRSKTEYYSNGKIPWVTSGALNNDYVLSAHEYITDLALLETNVKIFPKHTLLVALYGEGKTRGKCSELLIEAATNQAIASIVLTGSSEPIRPFLKWFLLKNYQEMRAKSSGGVQPNLNLGIIKEIVFPLAPIEEQEQIIAEIESRLSEADNLDKTLDAALAQSESLRQSILKQAFEGKLVPQDPNDEPAEKLLERIRAERAASDQAPKKRQTTEERGRYGGGSPSETRSVAARPGTPVEGGAPKPRRGRHQGKKVTAAKRRG